MEPARPLEPAQPQVSSTPQPAARTPMKKRPFLAACLSFFPGMGNIYNGLYLRGILFFAIVASLLALGSEEGSEHSVLGFVVAFVWIFNVIDSFRQAQLINYGYAQDLGLDELPRVPKASQGGLLAGLLLILLGVVASLEVFFGIEMSWVLRYWPLGILGLGAWLVVAYFRERSAGERSPEGDGVL